MTQQDPWPQVQQATSLAAQLMVLGLVLRMVSRMARMALPTPGAALLPRAKREEEERRGRCYELAWRFLRDYKEGTLIHGAVFGGERPRWVNHAWVELDDAVYEPQTDSLYRKEAFYRDLKAKPAQRYTWLEAATLALKTYNYGPWSSSESEFGTTETQLLPQTAHPRVISQFGLGMVGER